MNHVSSGIASDAEGQVNARRQFVRLFSDHPIRMAAAALMLAGSFNIPSRAYAQATEDAPSCIEKCKADEKACLNSGASEELCDYDSKSCQKACEKK
jgi:hypothetical protein